MTPGAAGGLGRSGRRRGSALGSGGPLVLGTCWSGAACWGGLEGLACRAGTPLDSTLGGRWSLGRRAGGRLGSTGGRDGWDRGLRNCRCAFGVDAGGAERERPLARAPEWGSGLGMRADSLPGHGRAGGCAGASSPWGARVCGG